MHELVHRYATLSHVKMHYVEAGSGPPLVLLHGYPETWYEWRHVIPLLAPRFRVIAPDLRGLGDTSRPAAGYDKRTVAADVRELLREHLKLDSIGLVGHDWGGPVAYALARLAPDLVRRLAIIDVVIPGDGRPGGISQGGARWHHGFHRTPHLPEALTAGREAIYLSYFYDEFVSIAGAITSADIAEYVRSYSQPGAMRCGFEYYRATDEDARVNARSWPGSASCASRCSGYPAGPDAGAARNWRRRCAKWPKPRSVTCCPAAATWCRRRRRRRSRHC